MKDYIRFNIQRLPLLIVVAVILLLSLIFKTSIVILAINNYYLFLNGAIYYENQSAVYFFIIGSSFLGLFLILTKKWMKTVVVILCLVLLLYICAFNGGLWESDKKYFCFDSPDKKNTLIIEECSWLLGGWSNCYIEVKPKLLKKLDSDIVIDDGYRPFSNGDYKIKWGADNILISYGFGSESKEKETEIRLK